MFELRYALQKRFLKSSFFSAAVRRHQLEALAAEAVSRVV